MASGLEVRLVGWGGGERARMGGGECRRSGCEGRGRRGGSGGDGGSGRCGVGAGDLGMATD